MLENCRSPKTSLKGIDEIFDVFFLDAQSSLQDLNCKYTSTVANYGATSEDYCVHYV